MESRALSFNVPSPFLFFLFLNLDQRGFIPFPLVAFSLENIFSYSNDESYLKRYSVYV